MWRTTGGKHRYLLGDCQAVVADDTAAFRVAASVVLQGFKGNPTALVVDANNKVELRQLVTSGTDGSNWIVESGVKEGDRVIVQGTAKVTPGMTVKTVDAQMPATPASAAQ